MMTKNYLNANDSGNFVLFGCAIDIFDKYIDGKAFATKDEITQLKHTRTRLLKFIELVAHRVDSKSAESVKRKLNTYGASIVPKQSKEYNTVHLADDDFDDLIELFIDSYCSGCVGKKDCLGRNVMRKALVPPLDAGHPVCEYCQLDRN